MASRRTKLRRVEGKARKAEKERRRIRQSALATPQPSMSTASHAPYGFTVSGALNVQDLKVEKVSNDMVVSNQSSNGDIKFSGSDAGSSITALTLDMSEAGAAAFNAGITADGPVTVNNGLTVTTTSAAFTLPRMTTTQRNALTAAEGMIIYNTTDDKFQGYAGSSWVNLH